MTGSLLEERAGIRRSFHVRGAWRAQHGARGRAGRSALALLAAALAGCALPGGAPALEQPGPQRPSGAEEWADAVRDLGRLPILPPSEDVYVGDVFASAQPPDGTQRPAELRTAAWPRWGSLGVLSELDAEYRRRPDWDPADRASSEAGEPLDPAGRAPLRQRLVGLRASASLRLDAPDLEPFLPVEVAPLIEGRVSSERYSVSLSADAAESYSLSVDTLMSRLVDPPRGAPGARPTLKPEHLRALPLAADRETGKAYLTVVSEVLSIRTLDATLRKWRAARRGPAREREEPAAAARRAAEMNTALAQSGLRGHIGGELEFVTVTDDSLTLRRSWPHALAVGVRGITLEVDAATGEVLRSSPLGVPLPALEVAQEEATEKDEFEVLEERRRGADAESGLHFEGLDGDLRVVVGGRLHLDAAAFDEDDEIDAAFGGPNPGGSVRRAFLELGGVYRDYEFNLWLDFSSNDLRSEGVSAVDFRNVFVGRRVPYLGNVRAGYFKEPFGLEETTSSNDITFLERSLTGAFVEGRNLGVMFQRRLTEQRRMTAALGLYKSADNDLEAGTGYGLTGRLTGAPILDTDGRRVLHLGASATYRDPGADGVRFGQRPESAQAQVLADTGTLAADRDVRVGAEVGAVLGPLSLQSEAMLASLGGVPGAGDPTFWSAYVMGSYVLTGESRSYRDRVGAFGSVHPARPFSGSGGRGAFELAGRYSYLDLDSGGVQGGTLHDWTLGLNWYANLNMRMMFDYVAAHPEGFGFQHSLMARLQVTF